MDKAISQSYKQGKQAAEAQHNHDAASVRRFMKYQSKFLLVYPPPDRRT